MSAIDQAMPPLVLLINPNTSQETTAMMHRLARHELPEGFALQSQTAVRGAQMITTAQDLSVAVQEVVHWGRQHAAQVSAIVVAAFGDPGVQALQSSVGIPVLGIGESAMREAAQQHRRFGVATTTPALRASIERSVQALGLTAQFTGCRIPADDPLALAAQPALQDERLAQAVAQAIDEDGAQAVVIGGGPLAESAQRIAHRFAVPVISPVAAAMRRVVTLLQPVAP